MLNNNWLLLLVLAVAVGFLLILLAIASPRAAAAEWTGTGEIIWPEKVDPPPVKRYAHKRRRTRRVVVKRFYKLSDDDRRPPTCKPVLAVVGDQAATTQGARNQAEKAWQQQVRFTHGERYADARNASRIRFACVDSSVRNLLNRATEALAGVNSQLKRCEMSAHPCRAPLEVEGTE